MTSEVIFSNQQNDLGGHLTRARSSSNQLSTT